MLYDPYISAANGAFGSRVGYIGSQTNFLVTGNTTGGVSSSGTGTVAITTTYVPVTNGAITEDAYGITININASFSTGSATPAGTITIGIDYSGGTSYTSFIADLVSTNASNYNGVGGIWYYFPLFIPAGASLGVIKNSGSANPKVIVWLSSKPLHTTRLASRVASLVTFTAGLSGTSVTAGTTNEGTWVQLSATTSNLWWWQSAIQVNSATYNGTNLHLDLAVGNATTKDIIFSDRIFVINSNDESVTSHLHIHQCERYVPSGSTLYARLQAGGVILNNPYRISIYGCG